MTTSSINVDTEILQNDLKKVKKSISNISEVMRAIKLVLLNVLITAILYTVTTVLVPIIYHKPVESFRDLTLMIFIGVIFLLIMTLLIFVSIRMKKVEKESLIKNEVFKVLHPRLAARNFSKEKTQENKDGKEMVRK